MVEITDEMTEAGALELLCFEDGECDSRLAAKAVFKAMFNVSPALAVKDALLQPATEKIHYINRLPDTP